MADTTQAIEGAEPTLFHYAVKLNMVRCAALCETIASEDGIGSYKHGDEYAVGSVNALTRAAIQIREGVKP